MFDNYLRATRDSFHRIFFYSCLRTINSWSEDRDVFNEHALKIRAEFDANKGVPVGMAVVFVCTTRFSSLNNII